MATTWRQAEGGASIQASISGVRRSITAFIRDRPSAIRTAERVDERPRVLVAPGAAVEELSRDLAIGRAVRTRPQRFANAARVKDRLALARRIGRRPVSSRRRIIVI